MEFTLITVLMTFCGATVQELKKVPFKEVFDQFGCSVYILNLLVCTFKGLLYYVKRRKRRHPWTGKRDV